MSTFDNYTFVVYLIIFLITGIIAGRTRRTTPTDFYVRQNHLPWYVIGFSLVTAGISSEQFIGTVGAVYRRGVVVANWEWGIAPAIVIMLTLFAPYYLKNRILTTPGFLEKRFDKSVSSLYASISVLIYVFINLAGVLYSGGFAMSQMLSIDIYVCIILLAITVGFFCIYGGMASLASTSVLQAIMLLCAGLLLFFLGINRIDGGLMEIIGDGERSSLIRPITDPDIPWTALLVLMFSTNIWYYCTSQNINQSVLGAKSNWHARMGLVFGGFLLLLVPLADIFPGLIAYKLNPNLPKADMAFMYVSKELLPSGGVGIIYAIIILSVVTAIMAGINSVTTIFTFDIYPKLFGENLNDIKKMKIGRFFSATILIIGTLYTPVVASFNHIFDFFQECWAFVAIPISLTFLLGILFKRMSANLAFYLMLLTFPMFLLPFFVKKLEVDMNIFNVAGIVWLLTFCVCILYMFVFEKEKVINDNSIATNVIEINEIQYPLYKRVSFWASIMILCYLFVYILLW